MISSKEMPILFFSQQAPPKLAAVLVGTFALEIKVHPFHA
jgi:hypothetical protein